MLHKRLITATVAIVTLAAASQAFAGVCEDLKGKTLFARLYQPAVDGAGALVGLTYYDFSGGVAGGLNYYSWFHDNRVPVGATGGEVGIRRISTCENDAKTPTVAHLWGEYPGETGRPTPGQAHPGTYYAAIYKQPDGSYLLENQNSLFSKDAKGNLMHFPLTVVAHDTPLPPK